MAVLTFDVPMTPPKVLSPNASRFTHWGTKTKARKALAKAFKYAAIDAVWDQVPHTERPVFVGPVRCQVTVYRGKGAQPWDGDNILASLKHGFDALAFAGVIDDDKQLMHDPVAQERDPAGKGFMRVKLSDEGSTTT